jgi:ribose-phosphate pyrophosphokinase
MSRTPIDAIKIFGGRSSDELAQKICAHLGMPLGRGEVAAFPDGEILVKVNEDVRGRDCYVVQATHQPVNDSLMELLVWIDCLKRASAERITAVIPYYGYARQDRKDTGRVPITAKLVANLITAAGADRVLAMDLHAAQIQGFFDIPVDHLNATPVIVKYFRELQAKYGEIVMASPDVGNAKMAAGFAEMLGCDLAIIDKRRKNGSEVKSTTIIGDVKDRAVFMVDDMISTAGTVCEAAKLLKAAGCREIVVAATHGVLVGPAMERLAEAAIDRVAVTDTIPASVRCAPIMSKLDVLSVAPLIGDAIHNIHDNKSVSSLLSPYMGKR